jgi:hypothetical protein
VAGCLNCNAAISPNVADYQQVLNIYPKVFVKQCQSRNLAQKISMARLLTLCCILLLCTPGGGWSQTASSQPPVKGKIIAGIEVGSKGVKLTILEKSLRDNSDFKLLKDSAVNSDFISFTAASYDATLAALNGLYTYTRQQWGVQPEDIATVISSGVKAQADKLNKNNHLLTFIEAFRIKISEESRNVEVVNVQKESILSHYGIIPDADRYNTFLIDIGSGNTKGGYFNSATKDFVMFQIPSGTKSTTNLTEKNCGTNCDFTAFKNAVGATIDSIEKKEIIFAVNASGAYPASNTMAISGGIAWAVATLLYPEKTDAQQVEVTYKDVNRFREGLIKFYNDIPDTNKLVIKGMKTAELSKIRRELQKVINVFDTKSLLAGSTLLLRIMRQFEAASSSKKFKLIKNGQVGWITGYITDKGRKEN